MENALCLNSCSQWVVELEKLFRWIRIASIGPIVRGKGDKVWITLSQKKD